jgi:methyltransferase family protein
MPKAEAELRGMIDVASLRLRMRRRAPMWVRHTVRLSRHVVPRWTAPPTLPPELLQDCRMCASREHLVEQLPRGGRIAEVGTERGRFAAHILSVCDPVELHLIVRLHQGQSHERMADVPDAYFDWVYIDGDHSYGGISRDIRAAAPKTKPDGFLVFNDFAHIDPLLGRYGVHRAVVEFSVAMRWPFAWFAYSAAGLYDVALRRPAISAAATDGRESPPMAVNPR